MRRKPNILVTGTPGVGKSKLCEELIRSGLNMEWIDVGQVAKQFDCYSGFDEDLECHVLDEDKLLDELESRMEEGGKIIDYHGCEFFPERWFDVVFVLRTNNTLLYDRLVKRGYSTKKLQNNVECEIFQTIYDEARDSYDKDIVHELQNETYADMERNISQISAWVNQWIIDNVDN
ncbi:adenylate kinase isoenzyme 6 [Adelges cooleyi]|uniref:adenylate kinase isoenzyme 6 n=1 Tax=Adelges cooleyi TaxID=133065 RepID=UPI00217F71FD|nr:adenylate kinase isoenzyme 6 [Adelges cooleyi]